MLKITILEDQPDQAERLSAMLNRYAAAHEDFTYSLQH